MTYEIIILLITLGLVIMSGFKSNAFSVYSKSFENKSIIPKTHVYDECGGNNKSPHIGWNNAPTETKSFALIVHDPDAPDPKAPTKDWVHWLIFNIPANITQLKMGIEKKDTILILGSPVAQGSNDFGSIGYDGPCPPVGKHRYIFELYALDTMLDIPAGANTRRQELEAAMKGHILTQAKLTGYYEK